MLRVKLFRSLFMVCLCMFVGACVPASGQTPAPSSTPGATSEIPVTDERLIVLGDISDDPGEVIDGSQPLADYLAAQLGDYGITGGAVRVAANADEMVALLENGEVDLYFDSVYPATLIGDASGALPILRRWRYGVETYYTVIFAGAESGVTSIDDLRGRAIALDNPYSTSGYLLPMVYLVEQGLDLVGLSSYEDAVAADEVGFVFSYDDENTLQWVLSGRVAAGATDDYHYDVLFPDDVKEKLLFLTNTESVPRQVVVVRPGIDAELLQALKVILMTAHESESGQVALDSFQTSRFDEFPEGIEVAQQRMRDMMEIVAHIPMP